MNAAVDRRYSDDEAEEIKRGRGKRAYIWGSITYKDAFGMERYTDFSQSVYWLPGKESEVLFGNYGDRHNDAN
jgi:hypothetical protein